MRVGGGKNKGSEFERKVCVELSLWVTKGARKDVFWRTAMSGGRATVHQRKGVDIRQAGDICSVAPEGHALTDTWFIECKHYRDLNIASFLINNRGVLARFWTEVCSKAAKQNKQPMIIARENNGPILVLVLPRKRIQPTHIISPKVTTHIGRGDIGLLMEMVAWPPP
jgi:hypothetical protein